MTSTTNTTATATTVVPVPASAVNGTGTPAASLEAEFARTEGLARRIGGTGDNQDDTSSVVTNSSGMQRLEESYTVKSSVNALIMGSIVTLLCLFAAVMYRQELLAIRDSMVRLFPSLGRILGRTAPPSGGSGNRLPPAETGRSEGPSATPPRPRIDPVDAKKAAEQPATPLAEPQEDTGEKEDETEGPALASETPWETVKPGERDGAEHTEEQGGDDSGYDEDTASSSDEEDLDSEDVDEAARETTGEALVRTDELLEFLRSNLQAADQTAMDVAKKNENKTVSSSDDDDASEDESVNEASVIPPAKEVPSIVQSPSPTPSTPYTEEAPTPLSSKGDIDADHDADINADINADHDADINADHDADINADHDADINADHDAQVSEVEGATAKSDDKQNANDTPGATFEEPSPPRTRRSARRTRRRR